MPITYCIVCNITGEKYYGSTKKTLEKRMYFHTNILDCCSKQIILRGDYDFYQLAEYETIEEAEMKEDWYIDNKKCINERRVRLTDEERTKYIKKKSKNYYYNNKEVIIEKRKEYYQGKKDYINEKGKETIECEFCKCIRVKRELKRHQKSKKCLEYQ